MLVNKAVRQKIFNCHKKLNVFLPCHVHQPKRVMRNPTFGVCKQEICISSAPTYACTHPGIYSSTHRSAENKCVWPARMHGSRGGALPLKNHKHIGFLSYTGKDPLKNYKATKLAMLGHHRLASESPFKWPFDGGTMMSRL